MSNFDAASNTLEKPLPPINSVERDYSAENYLGLNMTMTKTNVVAYLAGYLIKKVRTKGVCPVCIKKWESENNACENNPKLLFVSL